MADAPARLRAQQLELTRHLRDPDGVPAPPGLEERRVAVYRDLVFRNVESLLAGNFPVIRALHDDAAWHALVRAFLRDHRAQTPLFTEIAREFQRFLHGRDDVAPFLPELAHYEWVELALQIAEPDADALHAAWHDDDALLDGAPVLSPLAWPLAYRWPVHRIGPDYRPHEPPPQPTLLMARRESDGEVRFSELSALTFRLLQRLAEMPGLTGRTQLHALADEAGASDRCVFVADGARLLRQLRDSGVLLGANPIAP
ncbi:MAG TPA: putative DNA-binding domain-containing protein [Lysobacter sp.]|nr:putative DNA-binding domain-containing protein [Lysobacter sp.]